MIALPGELVIAAVEDCAAKGVPAVVIFSAEFNEAGKEGVARQQAMRAIIDRTGMRVIGPNCLGAFNSRNGAWLSFTSLFQERVDGPAIGMISQSGGSAAHVLKLAQERGLAVGTFITTGNEADVEFGEGLLALAEDPGTRIILAYIEGVRDAAKLMAGLEGARRARKPVIMLKVGRTSAAPRQQHRTPRRWPARTGSINPCSAATAYIGPTPQRSCSTWPMPRLTPPLCRRATGSASSPFPAAWAHRSPTPRPTPA